MGKKKETTNTNTTEVMKETVDNKDYSAIIDDLIKITPLTEEKLNLCKNIESFDTYFDNYNSLLFKINDIRYKMKIKRIEVENILSKIYDTKNKLLGENINNNNELDIIDNINDNFDDNFDNNDVQAIEESDDDIKPIKKAKTKGKAKLVKEEPYCDTSKTPNKLGIVSENKEGKQEIKKPKKVIKKVNNTQEIPETQEKTETVIKTKANVKRQTKAKNIKEEVKEEVKEEIKEEVKEEIKEEIKEDQKVKKGGRKKK
jgi:hypothetical protein